MKTTIFDNDVLGVSVSSVIPFCMLQTFSFWSSLPRLALENVSVIPLTIASSASTCYTSCCTSLGGMLALQLWCSMSVTLPAHILHPFAFLLYAPRGLLDCPPNASIKFLSHQLYFLFPKLLSCTLPHSFALFPTLDLWVK